MRSGDTETTGKDTRHGAKPFFWTMCRLDEAPDFYEWDVDPLTREPIIPKGDLDEILETVLAEDEWVFQNPKFDVGAMANVDPRFGKLWPWKKTKCTLMAGHLLASSQPHDLTTMAMVYLRVNIKPFEEKIQAATKAARHIARHKLPEWKIAKEGLEGMPSAKQSKSSGSSKSGKTKRDRGDDKDSLWAYDMWLPRAIVKHCILNPTQDLLPPHPQQPKTVWYNQPHDVRIDGDSKWANPYIVGRDGSLSTVVQKYAKYIWTNYELLNDLPELYGKTLGQRISSELSHGDVLRMLCHPWRTDLQDYANGDSGVTLPIYLRQRDILKERDLWEIYLERMKLPEITYSMEARGITINKDRKDELYNEYEEETERCKRICINIADGEIDSLPINGSSNALKHVLFNKFGLISNKKTDGGAPSTDKTVLEHWLTNLPPKAKAYTFISKLQAYRQRSTAMSYLRGYEKFWKPWIPVHITDPKTGAGWYVLHPSLNPTGTDTLRFSSSNPNEQNISKKEGFNLRYCFGPAPGREWWSCDAKNIELRIPAYEANERSMIDLFERPDDPPYYGSDHLLKAHILHDNQCECSGCIVTRRESGLGLFEYHSRNEKGELDGRLFKKKFNSSWYQWVKNGNFAVQYGAQEISGTADAAYHVKGGQTKVAKGLGRIAELNRRQIDHANKHGFVYTMPDKTVNPRHGYPLLCTRTSWGRILETVPLSYHVQGTAMWWMSKSMARCHNFLEQWNSGQRMMDFVVTKQLEAMRRLGYHLIMQVHDELVFDFPKGHGSEPWKTNLPVIRHIQKLMEKSGDDIGVPTPVSCEYHADNYSEGISV